MSVAGSCHCGAIAFEAKGAPSEAYECNCSHCARKGFLLWFTSPDTVRVTGDESALSVYHFNKNAIHHSFCPTCGVEPFARGKMPDGTDMVAINLRCAPDFDRSSVKIVPIDGKSF